MYTENILKHFYMDNAHPLSTSMIVRSLDAKKDSFQSLEENKKFLFQKYHILVLSEHSCILQIIQDQI
jgi:hypothetical protein